MMLLVRGRSFSSVPAVRDCTVVRSHRTRRNDDPCRKNLVSPNMCAKTSGISRISEPAEDSRARPLVGWCLIGIGILHSIIGLVTGRSPIKEGIVAGTIGAWDTAPDRRAIYWFLVTGFALILLGGAIATLERRGIALPWALVGGLGTLTLGGIVTMPSSGFWLLLVPLILAVARRRRRRTDP